jgi:hypothetical protein
MIVALQPIGGDTADLLQMLRRYRRRARVIPGTATPHGGPPLDRLIAELATTGIHFDIDRLPPL